MGQESDEANAAMDAASSSADPVAAAAAWAAADERLAADVGYVPLGVRRYHYLHGSGVVGYVNAASTFGFPDLAVVSLAP